MVEADSISGFEYNDYMTVNAGGEKMDKNKPYKAYFYDRSIWGSDGGPIMVVGTAPPSYTQDALIKTMDVLQNDLTVMSNYNYVYDGLLLESQGAEGPGLPSVSDKKSGWLVIFLRMDNAFKTSNFAENSIITSAYMSIPYFSNVSKLNVGRALYAQDICEWAGYIDLLQKSNHSIFADTEDGFAATPYPSAFDKDYARVIKYNRLPGHWYSGDILDYDPVSSTGSGIYLTHTQFFTPSTSKNPFANPFFKSPSWEQDLSRRELGREKQQSQQGKKEEKKKG
jgi:hypothetical protein